MIDHVRCEPELPDGYTGELQTKHFHPAGLLTHVITKDGRLLRQTMRAGADPDDPTDDICEMHDASLNGEFRFGITHHEYVAHFIDGQLITIRLAVGYPHERDRALGFQRALLLSKSNARQEAAEEAFGDHASAEYHRLRSIMWQCIAIGLASETDPLPPYYGMLVPDAFQSAAQNPRLAMTRQQPV